jgi:hypothetical protein
MSKKASNKYISNALSALGLLEVSIGRWTGVAKLNKGAAKAANDAGANNKAARLYVNLLGRHHDKLAKVNAAYAAIRTYLYENTLPYATSGDGQKRGPRILPVVRIPEVWTKLTELSAKAESELDEFLKEYDRLRGIAISEDMGSWSREIRRGHKYPSISEVRSKFRCILEPPKPIPNDAQGVQSLSLPLGMAADFASTHSDRMDAQLQQAKDAAVQQAKDQMETVAKQLKDGKRLHESLISNSKRVGRMLRDMVAGYDNDPRLIALADEIDKRIANIKSTDVWKTNQTKRDDSLEAATAVHKSLAAYAAGKPMPKAATPKKAATKGKPAANKSAKATKSKGKTRVGGIIGKSKSRKATSKK